MPPTLPLMPPGTASLLCRRAISFAASLLIDGNTPSNTSNSNATSVLPLRKTAAALQESFVAQRLVALPLHVDLAALAQEAGHTRQRQLRPHPMADQRHLAFPVAPQIEAPGRPAAA